MRKQRTDFKDLTGIKVGKLTCLSREVRKNKHGKNISYWKCLCECGNEKTIALNALFATTKGSATKSCGCYHKEYKRHNAKEYGESSFNKYFNCIKKAAEKRGYSFDLTKEQVKHINSQNCYYCGVVPYQLFGESKLNGKHLYNGIDRKINTIGYTIENSVPCCGICNKMKMNLPLDLFLEKCKLIVEKHG